MSPRNPLPRQTPKQYAQAVRNALPVKQAVKQDVITWQASHLEGEFWRILTHKGYPLATVADDVTQSKMRAQQVAELMADAPLLLNELKLTHDALLSALTMLSEQEQFCFEKLIPLSSRSSERLTLLMKYRHLLGGVQ